MGRVHVQAGPVWNHQTQQEPVATGSWLLGLSSGATALAFAAVCIQAVTEVKGQLKALQPGQPTSSSLGDWLVQLRLELQSQVASAGLAPEVSVAATLMMQHLAMLLSDSGAFSVSSAKHAAAAAAHSGRVFGLAVCESLQAALWLLHRQLAFAQGQALPVVVVLRQWVSDLRLHVSSKADEAVMHLISLI
jgi:hypothetical protein